MEDDVVKVWFQDGDIRIQFSSGETRSHPLSWFPRLLNASDEDRGDFELSPFGIHWSKLDEDLSFEGFLSYRK